MQGKQNDTTLNMENIKELMAEYRQLSRRNDAESEKRKDEIIAYIKEHATEEEKEYVGEFVTKNVANLQVQVACLRAQLGEMDYKLLPISYIAKEYFGKSASWLLQRLNGYKVRGKVYTLTQEQKETFNHAVQDIAKQLESLRLE